MAIHGQAKDHQALSKFVRALFEQRDIHGLDIQYYGLRELEPDGQWLLPIQIESGKILIFQKSMQPPRLRLVKTPATCH